jgi:ketosteroid isomerase-like protein
MSHANADLLQRLFTSLNQHDHQAMADCYHADATFSDIAFDLRGSKPIHAMWHMICETDIRASFHLLEVDDRVGHVNLIDDYTFSSTGRAVYNVIDSHFRLRDGLIIEHQDSCDARIWAAMALGGVSGFLAGRLRFLRSFKARRLLQEFIENHPGYQSSALL